MARIYAHRRGKSGSTKPISPTSHPWIRYKAKETEMLIIKNAKDGLFPSEIGLKLRDEYGIPNVKTITNKRINKIMKEKDLALQVPEDLYFLMKRAVRIRKHLENNKKDFSSKRAMQNTESKIWRLIKYYYKKGVIPRDWKYTPKQAALLVSSMR